MSRTEPPRAGLRGGFSKKNNNGRNDGENPRAPGLGRISASRRRTPKEREGGKGDRPPRKKEGRSEPETRAPREPARSRNPHVYALGIIGTRREAEGFGCLVLRLFPE